MLVAHSGGERVYAANAVKSTNYFCPECGGAVIVKQGRVKIWHFSHWRNMEHCPSEGETIHHLQLKDYLYRTLSKQGWVQRCELEYRIPSINRRADVYFEFNSNKIAIECQISPITIDDLGAKLADYTQHGIHTVYTFHGEKFPKPNEDNEAIIPAWIRELSLLQLNRLYVYWPQNDSIAPVNLAPVQRYKESAYDYDGNPVGGYFYDLKATKKTIYQPALQYLNVGFTKEFACKRNKNALRGAFLMAHFIA